MGNKPRSNWVSASDIGRASYCPHFLELKHKGAKPSKQAIAARARGEVSHEALNRQAEDTRCFVATHLYGSEHPKTCLLREYRDRELSSHATGRAFIRIYYALSPYLVIVSRKVPVINRIMRFIVNRKILRIQEERDSD